MTTNVHLSDWPLLYADRTLRLLVDQVTDYAIFLLTTNGEVATWNPGAQRIKGYAPEEIIGKHFRNFYSPEEQASKKPEYELKMAAAEGRFEDEGWRIRKDGSRFWANVIITAIRDDSGQLIGYGKVTRDLTERKASEVQLRELSHSLMRMQDEERGRFGRELHDTIGQYLVAVKMSLDGLLSEASLDEAQTRKGIAECLPLVERAVQEVRTMSYLLYPPMLDEMGLSAAMRWHIEGFSKRSGIRIDSEIADTERLPRDVELALFRVFQESLTNVHRHSQSKVAAIRLTVNAEEVLLEIEDRGKGMNHNLPDWKTGSPGNLGVGIRGMQERLRQLGGQLQIDSNSHGTTIKARISSGALKNSARRA